MKLRSLDIKNFRQISEADIQFGDASFLMGENNVGKSTALRALELFFSERQTADPEDFFKTDSGQYGEQIILEAKFTDLPEEALGWPGFRGHVYRERMGEEDVLCFSYRRAYHRAAGGLSEIDPEDMEAEIAAKLPRFLLMPAEKGASQKTMQALFEEIKELSENFKKLREYLQARPAEPDPENPEEEFSQMLQDVDDVVKGVFHRSPVQVTTNLRDPLKVIKPSSDIQMSEDVWAKLERQGMGSLRAVVFTLLRYRERLLLQKAREGAAVRDLIVGLEEPEMYLHHNEAALMRDRIYEVAEAVYSSIVCSTHSPRMIDLGRKLGAEHYPRQVLNLFQPEFRQDLNTDCYVIYEFKVTEEYENLTEDDQRRLRFLFSMDEHAARVFFCYDVIITETDLQEILLKETISRLPHGNREKFLSTFQVINTRGRSTIIPLVRYLVLLGKDTFVIHNEGAEQDAAAFDEPLLEALEGDETRQIKLTYTFDDPVEEVLEPAVETLYKTYARIQAEWGERWEDIPEHWRMAFEMKFLYSVPGIE